MHNLLRTPRSPEEWITFNKNLLKAHMTLTNTNYPALSAALLKLGIDEDPHNLKGRIWHGHFSAVFLLQCLRAMNVDTLHLPIDEISEAPPVAPRRRRPDLLKEQTARKKRK